jgi:transposase
MRDTTLYQHLLGIETPWTVSRVELDIEKQRVDVWVEHTKGLRWPCPECGADGTLHDHTGERVWRHLDSCQFQTFLHANPPRVQCPKHGVRQVKLPWAEPNSRFTLLFERFAIEVLLRTSIQAARRILRISWDEAWRILDRAVGRGLRRKPRRVISTYGVDEKSAGRGQDYITIICDLKGNTVEEVTEGNRKESFTSYLDQLNKEQIDGIEAVSMDMSKAYINAVLDRLPDGRNKIVFDRYHLMSHMGKAVDDVRKEEHARLGKKGDSPLKGSRFIWLYSRENLPEKHWAQFYFMRSCDLKTSRAWAIKENLRNFWKYKSRTWAERFWKKWYFWATHSRLAPVKKAAKTLKDHLYGILNYVHHRITNASVEGINSRIETMWKSACGFRNKNRFRTVILFHLGGLDLYPSTHTKS